MHARHRGHGNGYRSSSLGMVGGVASTSRISLEGSFRSHWMYSSDYRNYNRGYGRGQPKPFQPPQPSPHRGDIFVEAGRLATKYLVSKGFLPPNVLSGKWQNGNMKNQVGDSHIFRQQGGDNWHFPADAGPGRRRFSDEYNPTGSRNYMGGNKRSGSLKNYGSEWNRDIERRSWSAKDRGSLDKGGYDDAFSAYQEEQQGGKNGDSGEKRRQPIGLPPESDDKEGDSEADMEIYKLPDNVGSKATEKDLANEPDIEPTKSSEGVKILKSVIRDLKNEICDDETGKKSVTEDIPIHNCSEEEGPSSKSGNNALRYCRFANVPSRTHSSLTINGSKVDPVLIAQNDNIHEAMAELPKKTEAPIEDVSVQVSLGDSVLNESNQSDSFRSLESAMSKKPSEEGAGEGKYSRFICFLERPFMNDQESSEGLLGLGRCTSLVMDRREKRAAQGNDSREGTKRPREWSSSIETQANDYFHLSNSREKHQTAQEMKTSPGEDVILTAVEKSSVDIGLFPKVVSEPNMEYTEEKQLFPPTFKICDLNLMEASDVNENHDSDPIQIFPYVQQSKKEAAPVDIDLSMSNDCKLIYSICGADGKEVEVIDLESESVQEDKDKALNISEQKDETLFTALESFPNHAQNVNDIPDVHDGYGLMISELRGSDIPNCFSVRPDINSMHNGIGIHNGDVSARSAKNWFDKGILGDDDSIYMSLGETPICFSQVGEQQPTQDYEKPF